MHAIAPGKVILSGEHAVVYGAPALAVAARRHIHARFTADSQPEVRLSGSLLDTRYTLPSLQALVTELDRRFEQFLSGELPVNRLLDEPAQLIAYALGRGGLATGGELELVSDLPAGAGMGSSAAAIAATLLVTEALSGHRVEQQQRFELVRYCERLQHGRGSSIDAAAVTWGGLVRVEGDQIMSLNSELGDGWYQVDTGIPTVSTGECVQQVREQHADSAIWAEFADVTGQLEQALGDACQVHAALRQNHRLLQQIGVVPPPVARFVAAAEALGASAKISGAGAIAGDAGGQVLLYAPNLDISSLVAEFDYSCEPLQEDSEGARRISD